MSSKLKRIDCFNCAATLESWECQHCGTLIVPSDLYEDPDYLFGMEAAVDESLTSECYVIYRDSVSGQRLKTGIYLDPLDARYEAISAKGRPLAIVISQNAYFDIRYPKFG